jgi:hypothetical protein
MLRFREVARSWAENALTSTMLALKVWTLHWKAVHAPGSRTAAVSQAGVILINMTESGSKIDVGEVSKAR